MPEKEKRILVVDDDDAIRRLLLAVLQRRGFSVDPARDGVAAVELLVSCRYALLLLDLMMPRLSGWEVIDFLAGLPPGARPLVIVLTAGNEPRPLAADVVTALIHKPFDVDLLADMAAACLGTIEESERARDRPKPESGAPSRPSDEIDTLAEVVRECAHVVQPPDDPLRCPPAGSDVRARFDRSGSFYSN
jgi:CheY-like chemotaxis protein